MKLLQRIEEGMTTERDAATSRWMGAVAVAAIVAVFTLWQIDRALSKRF